MKTIKRWVRRFADHSLHTELINSKLELEQWKELYEDSVSQNCKNPRIAELESSILELSSDLYTHRNAIELYKKSQKARYTCDSRCIYPTDGVYVGVNRVGDNVKRSISARNNSTV